MTIKLIRTMVWRVWLLVLACLSWIPTKAVAYSAREALSPDFIKASLLVAGEGRAVYSLFGHTALRMQCPSKGLDYCFTFEMDMSQSSWVDFLTHKAKAGYSAAATPLFLDQYKQDGRGIWTYTLNLTPKEKQDLWRTLDSLVAVGATWTFDYYEVSCTSMTLYALHEGLHNDSLVFRRLPQPLLGNYHDVVNDGTQHSPWGRLFWNGMIVWGGGRHGDPESMMTPRLLQQALRSAVLIDSAGHARPLVVGPVRQLLPQILSTAPCTVRPWMVGVMICVGVVLLVITWRRRKDKVSRKGNKGKRQIKK